MGEAMRSAARAVTTALAVAVLVTTLHMTFIAALGLVTGNLWSDPEYILGIFGYGLYALCSSLVVSLVCASYGLIFGRRRNRTWAWWLVLFSLMMGYGALSRPMDALQFVWIWWPVLVAPPIAVETVRAGIDRSPWRVVFTRPSTAAAIVWGLAIQVASAITY